MIFASFVVLNKVTMKVSRTENLDLIVLEPRVFADNRGHFLEVYQAERYLEHGIPDRFVQDNLSCSTRGVVRGLHYQLGRPQGKLVGVLHGRVFDVVVDIRTGSPSFGRHAGIVLSSEDYRQIYIPEGFAHGFCVLSESAVVLYKCTDYYVPEEERGIRWDDPSLNIAWPVPTPVLSEKDRAYPLLKDMALDQLPRFSRRK
jgi:dTDP-4-dehydrorhamnose 3,5-epimerase